MPSQLDRTQNGCILQTHAHTYTYTYVKPCVEYISDICLCLCVCVFMVNTNFIALFELNLLTFIYFFVSLCLLSHFIPLRIGVIGPMCACKLERQPVFPFTNHGNSYTMQNKNSNMSSDPRYICLYVCVCMYAMRFEGYSDYGTSIFVY